MNDIDTEAGTAAYLQVPDATLRNWRYLRTGPPYVKVGRHVRYVRVDIDAWLAAQRVEGVERRCA